MRQSFQETAEPTKIPSISKQQVRYNNFVADNPERSGGLVTGAAPFSFQK